MSRPDALSFFPVIEAYDLPECIVWPPSDFAADATVWWVANDAETASGCYLDTTFGTSIERKENR